MSIFDTEIVRKGTGCAKWDAQGGDYLPMWVADMDFASPAPLIEAVERRVRHGVFGYGVYPEEAAQAVIRHYRKKYDVEVRKEWIVWIPSVMPGATLACRVGGGSLLYNTPMYSHIRKLPKEVKAPVIEVPLEEHNLRYSFSLPALEAALTPEVGVYILCNPHNPVGRVWTRAELGAIEDFAAAHRLLVISDEIHCELILEGRHIPYFSLSERAAEHSITLSSAGKIANMPGLPMGFAIIPNPALRRRFKEEARGLFSSPNVLTVAAITAAYDGSCEAWKKELLAYLRENRDLVEARVKAMPGLDCIHNEATYLCWIDARAAGLPDPYKFFRDKAGVRLNDGLEYGVPGFVRLNFGCPRKQLTRALDLMEEALRKELAQ